MNRRYFLLSGAAITAVLATPALAQMDFRRILMVAATGARNGSSSTAMKTPLFMTGSATTNVSNLVANYTQLAAGGNANSTAWGTVAFITNFATPIATAGTIDSLAVKFPTTLSQGSYVVTLQKGATAATMVDTALTVTIDTSNAVVRDTTHSVSVSAGDFVCWKVAPSGTPTAQTSAVQIACQFTSASGVSLIASSYLAAFSATEYHMLGGWTTSGIGTETAPVVVMPCAGSIGKMYVSMGAAPGIGATITITLRKGTALGGLSDTSLTVTFGAADISKSIDLGGSPIALSTGDFLSISVAFTGSPSGGTSQNVTVEFIPTVPGNAVLFGNFSGALSTAAVRYGSASGNSSTTQTTEANVAQIAPVDFTVKSIRYDLSTAPASGKTRTATLRKGASDTALTTIISNTALTNTATTDVSVSATNLFNLAMTPSGTPTASTLATVSSVVNVT